MTRIMFKNARSTAPARFGLAAIGLLALAGCSNSHPTQLSGPAAVAPLSGAPAVFSEDPLVAVLHDNDQISVTVLREKELSLDRVTIGIDGSFEMPAIGKVQATGRNVGDVAAEIRSRLGKSYLVNPQVAVNIVEYGSLQVTVEGSVFAPGVFKFDPNTTLLGAVALARGPNRTAKLNQVAIFRKMGAERSVAVFDLKQVRAGQMVDPVLQPGDRVVVGFSGLSQAWQDFLMSVPVLALFTRL